MRIAKGLESLHRRWMAPALCLAIFILGSCSGGSDDDAGGNAATGPPIVGSITAESGVERAGVSTIPGPDPCTLVTPPELLQTFRSPFGPGTRQEIPGPFGQVMCTWTTTEAPPVTFTVSILTTGGIDTKLRDRGQTAHAVFSAARTAITDVQPVEGVGDDAFTSGPSVYFVKGDSYVTAGTSPGASSQIADLRAVALIIGSRI